jgi:1,4-dihydroxy-2-naphthoate polyprenyltransferase
MSSAINLLKVARPQFLIGGLALFVLGVLWAVLSGAAFSPLRFLLGLLIVLASQLAVHFSNDYFDAKFDRPGRETLISGGAGVLVRQPELRERARRIALELILFSLVVGSIFLQRSSLPYSMLWLLLFGNLLGWYYSAPPLRFSQRGLGELCYGFIGGFLVPSLGYLAMQGEPEWKGILLLVAPLTLYALVSILGAQIPDMEDDRLAKKWNWIARGGRGFGFTLIGLFLLTATAYFFLFPSIYTQPLPADLRVLGLFSLLPLTVGIVGMIKRPSERKPATKIATGIVIALVVFAVLVDGYLLCLTQID